MVYKKVVSLLDWFVVLQSTSQILASFRPIWLQGCSLQGTCYTVITVLPHLQACWIGNLLQLQTKQILCTWPLCRTSMVPKGQGDLGRLPLTTSTTTSPKISCCTQLPGPSCSQAPNLTCPTLFLVSLVPQCGDALVDRLQTGEAGFGADVDDMHQTDSFARCSLKAARLHTSRMSSLIEGRRSDMMLVLLGSLLLCLGGLFLTLIAARTEVAMPMPMARSPLGEGMLMNFLLGMMLQSGPFGGAKF